MRYSTVPGVLSKVKCMKYTMATARSARLQEVGAQIEQRALQEWLRGNVEAGVNHLCSIAHHFCIATCTWAHYLVEPVVSGSS